MSLGQRYIDDYLTFCCNTHSDAGVVDADSAPTYRIYEDETATPILTGTMALLDSSNTDGFYSEQIQLTAANGFEYDKSYTVRISATVSSVTEALVKHFTIKSQAEHLVKKAALGMIPGTVSNAGHTPTTTEFEASDVTEATADHYNNRVILFTSGALVGQACLIGDYAIASGRGHFTVNRGYGVALTEAPANTDNFVII